MFRKTLAAVTVAFVLAAPAAYAAPADLRTPSATQEAVSEVPPPPPSLMAASAAEEYEQLRAAGAPAGVPAVEAEPSTPGGFDWVSAAIGAATASALALLALGLFGPRRPTGRTPARA
jgi:hypothetical protein